MTELLLSCIPSVLTGIFLFFFQQKASRQERHRDEKENVRNQYIKIVVDLTLANYAVCEANAIALKRGRASKETEDALEYARQIKHKHREFLETNGIRNIF